MNDAELRCLREALGLSTKWMAAFLGVDEREYRRMENDQRPGHPATVKDDQAAMLQGLWLFTQSRIQDEIMAASEDGGTPAWVTYRTDDDAMTDGIEAAPDGPPLTAAWHRAVITAAWSVVGGTIAYYPEALERRAPIQEAAGPTNVAALVDQAQDDVSSQ